MVRFQVEYSGFEKVDVIIEAVPEDLSIKHKVIQEVESVVKETCVIASNTSALPISQIAKVSKRPSQVVGMHYFSPVEKMDLLEIITTETTSKETAAIAVELGLKQGKTVITVKDGPGFYTTRILSATLSEIFELIREGVDMSHIDKVMTKFGFPVGPIQLIDEVGIDVGYHVAKDLGAIFKERMGTDLTVLDNLIKKRILGKKTNKGFFNYDDKKKRQGLNQEVVDEFKNHMKSESFGPLSDEDLALRLAGKMINESIYCLQENIIDNPVDGDIGAVFGLGFPPFHGGPFRFVDTYGARQLVTKLEEFTTRFGPRFKPAPLLLEKATTNTKFHKD